MKEFITYRPLPIPLPFKQGWLYGATLHDWRYPSELETLEFFEKNLTKSDVIADIGANIGYYTILFSKLAKDVVAFEPSSAFRFLQKTTKHCKNVNLEKKGVYSYPCRKTLYNAGTGLGSVVYSQEGRKEEIELISLKDYSKSFTWAKIDVEGAELEVLKDMEPCKCVVEAASLRDKHEEIRSLGYEIHPLGNGNLFLEPNTRV
ncbi:FkbM family methyltransferase [Candidatus Parcubacteria bacterium]|nr:MAG: FkbM family methyltransferase [Candidatus Parcubacteria bacterium]